MSNNPHRNWPIRRLRRSDQLRKKIARAHDRSGDQLREKGNRQDEIAQRSGRLQHAAINVERVGERMKRVERDADRQKDIEMRRLVDDADARQEPLEIFEQEVSVFEKPEHAQVHADAGDQPDATRDRRSFALAICRPSQKSIAVVEKRSAAKGGFQAP